MKNEQTRFSEIVKGSVNKLFEQWGYDKAMRYLKMHDKELGLKNHIEYLETLKKRIPNETE